MDKILLDTNFLMAPAQFKVNIYEMLDGEPITLSVCVRELEKLAAGKSKDAASAKISLAMAKKYVKIIKSSGRADSAIISYASANDCTVATNDTKLIKVLKSKGIKVIRLRQKKLLVEE
jgi:uncharacterized protein